MIKIFGYTVVGAAALALLGGSMIYGLCHLFGVHPITYKAAVGVSLLGSWIQAGGTSSPMSEPAEEGNFGAEVLGTGIGAAIQTIIFVLVIGVILGGFSLFGR